MVLREATSPRKVWFIFRVGFVLLAMWVAVSERWDANGDGQISPHEVLLFAVRFLAFPLHIILSLTPTSVLHWLGLPDADWPSSAFFAVVISLSLWGVLLIGSVFIEAWLEDCSKVRRAQRDPSRLDPTTKAGRKPDSR